MRKAKAAPGEGLLRCGGCSNHLCSGSAAENPPGSVPAAGGAGGGCSFSSAFTSGSLVQTQPGGRERRKWMLFLMDVAREED